MSTLKIFKEVALPSELQANSLYFIAPPAKPDYVEIYVTGTDSAVVKRVLNQSDVETLVATVMADVETAMEALEEVTESLITNINATSSPGLYNDINNLINTAIAGIGPSGINNLHVVDNIAARDALAPIENIIVLVTDATGDNTVSSGGATYVYDVSKTLWKKIGETESMDLVLSWSNINNRPTSAVADIDDAVTKRHTHTNKLSLDKVGEDENGDFTYNGLHPKIHLDSENW